MIGYLNDIGTQQKLTEFYERPNRNGKKSLGVLKLNSLQDFNSRFIDLKTITGNKTVLKNKDGLKKLAITEKLA